MGRKSQTTTANNPEAKAPVKAQAGSPVVATPGETKPEQSKADQKQPEAKPTAAVPTVKVPVPRVLPEPILPKPAEAKKPEPKEKPKHDPGATHKAPRITATELMPSMKQQMEQGRDRRLQQLARRYRDVAWLLGEYEKLKKK